MANFNKVILLGNLTRDVELRYTQGGLAVAKFGMAISRKFTTNGESRETTCFVDLTAFARQAEVLQQYVSKGSQLFVDGRLEYSTWENQEGQKRSKLEVIVENFQFVGSRSGEGSGPRPPRQQQAGGQQAGGQQAGGQQAGGQPAGGQQAGEQVDYGDIPF